MSSGCSLIRYMICCFLLLRETPENNNRKDNSSAGIGKAVNHLSPFKKNAHTHYLHQSKSLIFGLRFCYVNHLMIKQYVCYEVPRQHLLWNPIQGL